MLSYNADGGGAAAGEIRLPSGWNPASASLFSQDALVESTEPGHSKEEWTDTALSLGTCFISSGARRGRGHEREKDGWRC